jgi:uncharacterized lipoprotein YbaY
MQPIRRTSTNRSAIFHGRGDADHRREVIGLLRAGALAVLMTGALVANARAQSDQSQAPSSVTGTVSYTVKSALPASAMVHVQLVDVTQQDNPVTVIAQQVITNPGQVPIPFEIHFDPTSIDPNHTYSVRADISADGEIIFASTMPNVVLTMGNPAKIDVTLDPITSNRPGVVTGTVAYMERIALPTSAVVRVRLEDSSSPDAPPFTVGQQVIQDPGQSPVPFAIRYDQTSLDPRHTYTVSADITAGGELMFTTTGSHRVLTQGNPSDAEVLVQTVSSGSLNIVTGTVTTDGSAPLPSNAIIHLLLMDVPSSGPEPGISQPIYIPPLGEEFIADPGEVPLPFGIKYDPALVDPTHTYAVLADVTVNGKVLYETIMPFPVITQNNPAQVQVVVEPPG